MKKLSILFMALVAAVSGFAQVKIDDLYYNLNQPESGFAMVTRDPTSNYAGLTAVRISDVVKYDGKYYSVAGIEENTFADNSTIETADISFYTGNVEIGDRAFANCSKLNRLSVYNCFAIAKWGNEVFANCTALTDIWWDVKRVLQCPTGGFFSNSKSIRNFDFGHIVRDIPPFLCSSMPNLKCVYIPDDVTSIGEYAFFGSGTRTARLPQNEEFTTIPECAFADCRSLTQVTIPDNVTEIQRCAFDGCWELASVQLGSGLKYIREMAFMNCNALTTIDIPASVTNIQARAFADCDELIAIIVEKTNPNYTTSKTMVGCLFNKDETLLLQVPGGKQGLLEIDAPRINQYAVAYCKKLTAIHLTKDVTEIQDRAFDECTGLTEVTCDATTPPTLGANVFLDVPCATIPLYVPSASVTAYSNSEQWKDFIVTVKNPTKAQINRIYYKLDPATKTAIVTCENETTSNYSTANTLVNIPATVTYGSVQYKVVGIEKYAFKNCSVVRQVVIGSNVETIGYMAFAECSNLDEIVVGENVTNFGHLPFYHTSLTKVTWKPKNAADFASPEESPFYIRSGSITNFSFGDEVEHIPAYMCYEMNRIGVVSIGANVKSIGDYAFYNTQLGGIGYASHTFTKVGKYAFAGCRFYSTTLPATITEIPEGLFANNTNLKYATIPNSVTSVGPNAFAGCTALENLVVGKNVNVMGNAFSGCAALTTIEWKAIDCAVNEPIFADARNSITSLTFGEEVTRIPDRICYEMAFLKTLTIPENIKEIGTAAFFQCKNLTDLTISSNVSRIGADAFSNCNALKSVTCHAFFPPWLGTGVFSDVPCSQIPLYVPSGYVIAYQRANQWKEFYPISAIEDGIEEVMANPATNGRKVLIDGQVLIRNNDKLFNLQGQEVK